MAYVLKDLKEVQRLEKQSNSTLFDPMIEMEGFDFESSKTLLDAGCGSGIVARKLAQLHKDLQVTALDASSDHILEARGLASDIPNIVFQQGDLIQALDKKFDRIICRYVVEHMSIANQVTAIKNLCSSLNPKGKILLIDIDGYLQNIYPRTKLMQECLDLIQSVPTLDLFVGRRLPHHLIESGMINVKWNIQTLALNEKSILQTEIDLIKDRFVNSLSAMSDIFGSKATALQFQQEYIETLKKPGSTLFYNKFIVTGEMPSTLMKIVK